jgi:hypothetical protein
MTRHNNTPDSWIERHPIQDEPDPDICPDCHVPVDECICEPEEEFTGLVCDLCGQWIDSSDDAREWSDDLGQTGRGGFVHSKCYRKEGGPE